MTFERRRILTCWQRTRLTQPCALNYSKALQGWRSPHMVAWIHILVFHLANISNEGLYPTMTIAERERAVWHHVCDIVHRWLVKRKEKYSLLGLTANFDRGKTSKSCAWMDPTAQAQARHLHMIDVDLDKERCYYLPAGTRPSLVLGHPGNSGSWHEGRTSVFRHGPIEFRYGSAPRSRSRWWYSPLLTAHSRWKSYARDVPHPGYQAPCWHLSFLIIDEDKSRTRVRPLELCETQPSSRFEPMTPRDLFPGLWWQASASMRISFQQCCAVVLIASSWKLI